jgi:hypothetical protein
MTDKNKLQLLYDEIDGLPFTEEHVSEFRDYAFCLFKQGHFIQAMRSDLVDSMLWLRHTGEGDGVMRAMFDLDFSKVMRVVDEEKRPWAENLLNGSRYGVV